MILKLANISNGLAFPHDDVCHFQSQFGHHAKYGYFRIDSMPYSAIIHLLQGNEIEIIDATAKDKPLTDAFRYGIPTWCLVINRTMKYDWKNIRVCEWQTKEMINASKVHEGYMHSIRKLVNLYGNTIEPITIGNQVKLTCHRLFQYDDRMNNGIVYGY